MEAAQGDPCPSGPGGADDTAREKCCEFLPLPLAWKRDGWEPVGAAPAAAEKDTGQTQPGGNGAGSSAGDAPQRAVAAPAARPAAAAGEVQHMTKKCRVTTVRARSHAGAPNRGPAFVVGKPRVVAVPHPSSQHELLVFLAAILSPSQDATHDRAGGIGGDGGDDGNGVGGGRVFTDCGFEVEAGTAELVSGDRLFYSPDGHDLSTVTGDRIQQHADEEDGGCGDGDGDADEKQLSQPRARGRAEDGQPSGRVRVDASTANTAVAGTVSGLSAPPLPLLFQGFTGPRWFAGLEYHQAALLGVLGFLVPSQDLPRLAAVDRFLSAFVREHAGQVSLSWLRQRMGLPPNMRRPVAQVDKLLHGAMRYEPPQLQYVSYLDGTVFDTTNIAASSASSPASAATAVAATAPVRPTAPHALDVAAEWQVAEPARASNSDDGGGGVDVDGLAAAVEEWLARDQRQQVEQDPVERVRHQQRAHEQEQQSGPAESPARLLPLSPSSSRREAARRGGGAGGAEEAAPAGGCRTGSKAAARRRVVALD